VRREAMNFVWCEWICKRCNQLHRVQFSVKQVTRQTSSIKGIVEPIKGLYILDTASIPQGKKSPSIHGSKIFVQSDMELKDVFAALADHMTLYYDVEPESLSMDVCRE
jgi:hypothetical protein